MKRVLFFLLLITAIPCFSQQNVLKTGQLIPDFSASDMDGKTIARTNFAGSILLIEFWSSWDKNSRQNHSGLIKLYNRYRNYHFIDAEGFAILSISLDKDKQSWINAIDQDALNWNNHLCSFKYWECPLAKQFSVRQLPSYFLIDGQSRLVG